MIRLQIRTKNHLNAQLPKLWYFNHTLTPLTIMVNLHLDRHYALLYDCYFLRQVGGAVVIFEVQRSARSEARKEEARKQELEVELQLASSLNP